MHVEEGEIQAFGPAIMGTVLDYDHDDFVRELAGGSPMAVSATPVVIFRAMQGNEYPGGGRNGISGLVRMNVVVRCNVASRKCTFYQFFESIQSLVK